MFYFPYVLWIALIGFYLVSVIFRKKLYLNHEPDFPIRFDLRQRKTSFSMAVIFSLLCAFSMFSHIIDSTFIVIDIVFMFRYTLAPICSIIFWLDFMRCSIYLKRLEKYGYEIPNNKKLFSSDLKQLPKIQQEFVNIYSKESTILSVICIIISWGLFLNIIKCYFSYKNFCDIWTYMAFGSIPPIIFWTIWGIILWNQRSSEKYRDDMEIDKSRKPRKQLEKGLIEIIVYLICTLIWISLLYTLCDITFQSRLEAGWYN